MIILGNVLLVGVKDNLVEIVKCISMNEAQVVIVHNSKSKRENLNVYIYCCIKKHVISEEMSSKKEESRRRPSNHCDFKKMYYLY
jgi:hypothetical protein